jgi:hypothetical protein
LWLREERGVSPATPGKAEMGAWGLGVLDLGVLLNLKLKTVRKTCHLGVEVNAGCTVVLQPAMLKALLASSNGLRPAGYGASSKEKSFCP